MSGKKTPLVTWKDGSVVVSPTAEVAREFVEGELTVTPLGRDVLVGNRDWQTVNVQTRWLGGVEIAPGETGWRWDAAERVMVRKDEKKAKTRKAAKRPSKRKK